MIDITYIRDHPDEVKQSAEHKNIAVDIDKLLKIDGKRRKLMTELDDLRQKRNEIASKMKGGKPEQSLIEQGRDTKEQIAKLEVDFEPIDSEYSQLLADVPNLFSDDTPIGGEEDSVVVDNWGENDTVSGLKDHLSWLESRQLVDFERGAKVAGSKFYYSLGVLAQLELALLQFALDKASEHGFTVMNVPNMVSSRVLNGTGFAPRGEEGQVYEIKDDDLNLIGTAEIPLTAYHQDEILNIDELPLLYVGWSPCYRREAGAYGKHSKGLFRVHQFYKAEMYVFCKPEDSAEWHEKLVKIEEEIVRELGIPYHKLAIASGDLGAPAYKKFDIEYWSPIEGEFRELMSCSNVTDYQARRLNIRYRDTGGNINYVHTLNGTAMVTSRGPIAVIENFQTKEGSVEVPKVLQKYLNGRSEI